MDFRKRELEAIAIIPARLESVRFPNKLIQEINGKPLIYYTIENAKKSKYLRDTYVATDSEQIFEIAVNHGAKSILTPKNIETGTDRIAWAYKHLDETADIIFNLQADEPLVDAVTIDSLFEKFSNSLCHVGTLIKRIEKLEELENPNNVKVALEIDSSALFFSRSPIPYYRDLDKEKWLTSHKYWKHIGVYAYRDTALEAFSKLPQTDLELVENLEQLRLLQNNFKYYCMETKRTFHGVDTPEDLEIVKKILLQNG